MKAEDIKIGDKVIYIPEYLLTGDKDKMIIESNLGIVTSKNDQYVFVKYKGNEGSQATRAEDLYSLKNRLDLADKI